MDRTWYRVDGTMTNRQDVVLSNELHWPQFVLSASLQESPKYPYTHKQGPVFVIHMLSSCPYQVTECVADPRTGMAAGDPSTEISCPIACMLSPDVAGQMRGGQVPSALQLWGQHQP